jgi:CRP-like cAMP-binding protein/rhodanese-related sulfurtransferase
MTGTDILQAVQLAFFSPLDGLKQETLEALARSAPVRQYPAGRPLFKQGDAEKCSIYLLAGAVELRDGDQVIARVRAGSDQSRNPLGPALPRRYTAMVVEDAQFISLDSDQLDLMITWDQTGIYEVTELQDHGSAGDDWMTALLQTKVFHRIPAANIQAVFMRMERINLRSGDVVIKQGDEGDYFYVVTSGRCVVTRETPLHKEGIRLAELGVGDTFGEEALISSARRNATVTMLADGSLMRLGKDDFCTLLNEPMLDWVDAAEGTAIVANGGTWLDVRLPSEFENFHLPEAINVPLYFVRLKLKTLDPDTPYVVCCDTGRRSSAAAFILNKRGFKASVLRSGLNSQRPA